MLPTLPWCQLVSVQLIFHIWTKNLYPILISMLITRYKYFSLEKYFLTTADQFVFVYFHCKREIVCLLVSSVIYSCIWKHLDISFISYHFQMGVSKPGTILKSSVAPSGANPVTSAVGRKPLADSASSANRKPVLGKGVPPPVPPNKPVVPVKKTGDFASKRSDSVVEVGSASVKTGTGNSVVAGLQGLKFGISLSNSDSNKGIKTISDSSVPAKKFFNNIESKSWRCYTSHKLLKGTWKFHHHTTVSQWVTKISAKIIISRIIFSLKWSYLLVNILCITILNFDSCVWGCGILSKKWRIFILTTTLEFLSPKINTHQNDLAPSKHKPYLQNSFGLNYSP